MSNITKSICWAAAILLVALGNRLGLIGDRTGNALFIVLPIAAVLSLKRDRACWPRRKEA